MPRELEEAYPAASYDVPVTGRWDGENFAIGMVDVTDTPYWELTAMMRKIGANMIPYRLKGEFKCDWE